jgi:hypothetical protein
VEDPHSERRRGAEQIHGCDRPGSFSSGGGAASNLEVELEAVKHHIKLRSHIGVCWNRKPGHIDFGV